MPVTKPATSVLRVDSRLARRALSCVPKKIANDGTMKASPACKALQPCTFWNSSYRRGQPAVLRALHQSIDQQRGRRRRRQRARHIEAAARRARDILGDHQECRDDGDARQQDVDEEHRRPAIGAGQHAAGQRPQRQTAGAGAAPDRQRAVARRAFLEQAVDQRQRGRKQQRGANALHRARDHDDRRAPGQSADQRRQRVQPQRADEHAPLARQVDGAPAQQQEAAAEHRIGADHPLQGLLGKTQARADLRQGHEHDVDIQGVDELGKGEQRQAPAQRTLAGSSGSDPMGGRTCCRCAAMTWMRAFPGCSTRCWAPCTTTR